MPEHDAIAAAILQMTAARGPGKSICPSEVARKLAPEDWRAHMATVRAVAAELTEAGKIRVTQGGETVNPKEARGAIRLTVA